MDDVLKIEGIEQEHADVLLAFLSELTEDTEDSPEGETESAGSETAGVGDSAEASPPVE
jgi:hypothetical protein